LREALPGWGPAVHPDRNPDLSRRAIALSKTPIDLHDRPSGSASETRPSVAAYQTLRRQ
jgi:hypothetical protein